MQEVETVWEYFICTTRHEDIYSYHIALLNQSVYGNERMTLRQWLRRTKTTQAAFGARIRMDQADISRIAAHGTNNLRLALRIASVTRNKVTPRELLPPEYAE